MPIAEIMAGITLVKASVDFIKSNIDTAKDIGEIAGAVDGLFRGQEEIEKKRRTLSIRANASLTIPICTGTESYDCILSLSSRARSLRHGIFLFALRVP